MLCLYANKYLDEEGELLKSWAYTYDEEGKILYEHPKKPMGGEDLERWVPKLKEVPYRKGALCDGFYNILFKRGDEYKKFEEIEW